MAELLANSGGPDDTPCSIASDLGLRGSPVTFSGVSRLQWVRQYVSLRLLFFYGAIFL